MHPKRLNPSSLAFVLASEKAFEMLSHGLRAIRVVLLHL